ncbi:DUF1850 domain-containing protein [Desulforamulus putei]|uniref:DUF1850 domain-containing protein n=1 Tax=Desulforamulus putei DSM 12395 TaxID=1121429 RepID=A0A1M4XZI3_9FIRM|nr:DUF1850 domain-containing protein [Desulforamulus putei]SHE98838.1 hypothetical protein SAMN02745133_01584 [Desulforamulus putei DSM 12395]
MTGLFRRRTGRIWVLASIVLAVLLLVPLPTLLLSSQQGEPVLLLPMLFDQSFTVEYIHSVNKTPVQEHFILAPGNDLLLTSTTFKALGVGTPFLPEEGKLENRSGVYVLSGINRHFKQINMAFMPLTRHALVYRGKRYDFKDYFPPGSLIALQAKPCSLAKIIALNIWKEVKLDRSQL